MQHNIKRIVDLQALRAHSTKPDRHECVVPMQPEEPLFGSKCGPFPGQSLGMPDFNGSEVCRMRRGDLMKPDLVSEIVLLGSGAVIFIVCLFIMLAALAGQIR